MKFFVFLFVFGFSLIFASDNVEAKRDPSFLDPPYKKHYHPRKPVPRSARARDLEARLDTATDLRGILPYITSVKAQGSRGTCSIFSATAMLESMLVKQRGAPIQLDLSEEYLEYLIMRVRGSEGSNAYQNFNALKQWGVPQESEMPYIGQTWENNDFGLPAQRCGGLGGFTLRACLLGHYHPALLTALSSQLTNPTSPYYNPEFLTARESAMRLRNEHLRPSDFSTSQFVLRTQQHIKALLTNNTPVVVGLDFFYGAWNHRKASELGMQRNMQNWDFGIVGFPERGSVDLARSREKPAGHSIQIIGYDDQMTVTIPVQMTNGTVRDFTYQGVYFFKNSWGTTGFGQSFTYKGRNLPGFGIIVQKYAHTYGTFFQLPLNRR